LSGFNDRQTLGPFSEAKRKGWRPMRWRRSAFTLTARQSQTHRRASQSRGGAIGGGNEGGVRAAARELGVARTTAQEAIKVASLSAEAKAAAIEHGMDDNKSALFEAVKE
jgi:hypothetical protein